MKFKKVYTGIVVATIVAFSTLLLVKTNLESVKVNAESSKSISYPQQLSVSGKNKQHQQDYLNHLAQIEKEKAEKVQEQKQAAEKKAEEDAQKEKAEQAQKLVEQQKASESEAANSTQTNTNATQASTVQEKASSTTTTNNNSVEINNTPASTTNNEDHSSGFNFGGYHFPLAGFSGSGQVPATQYVYRWSSRSNWYLLEQGGSAGQVVKSSVGMGTAITVDGKTYHVTDIQSGLDRTTAATSYMWSHIDQHAIGFQTCDDATHLTLYFAD